MAAGSNPLQTGSSTAKSAKPISSNAHAVRVLMHEFQNLQKEPMEGFRVRLLKDDNLFEWEVAIFGPPETLYAGGYFKAVMKFPQDYPFLPPSVKFVNKLWHPNVYENGTVCISILHPPTDDPRSGELPCERWNPTQNVHSVLMSIISLLNEPNTSSPANVDASVMYRRYKEKGDKDYERMVREQVDASKLEATRDGVTIPTTVDEYCVSRRQNKDVSKLNNSAEFVDFGPSDSDDSCDSPFSFSSDEPLFDDDSLETAPSSRTATGKRKEADSFNDPEINPTTPNDLPPKRSRTDENRNEQNVS
ncbi:ubiquitin-conjugating enzyme E2 R2-like [Paramacrobiotus metropolitanus]|uniref:ubiquitin-conjugating enzyme E2 R2-like n=1 Tax=Paramacrobiotus metropolitanus TaxID=2943436 RepID=UPI00244566B6|nr:ubiquitin-conjugating enzyme E2 R2-like [Paramacrobiotus metropolitanus]